MASAEDQMRFQLYTSNTSHQREVEDLKKAGLNPVLSAGSLSGAQAMSGASDGSSGGGSGGSGSAAGDGKDKYKDNPIGTAIEGLNPNGSTFGIPNWLIQSGYETIYDSTGGDFSIDNLANMVTGGRVSGVNFANTIQQTDDLNSQNGSQKVVSSNSAAAAAAPVYNYKTEHANSILKQNLQGFGRRVKAFAQSGNAKSMKQQYDNWYDSVHNKSYYDHHHDWWKTVRENYVDKLGYRASNGSF